MSLYLSIVADICSDFTVFSCDLQFHCELFMFLYPSTEMIALLDYVMGVISVQL